MATERKTLKQLRNENRYTLREVSDKSGVAFSTYVSYELGYRRPSLGNAQKLADFYKCKVDDINFEVAKNTA